MTYRAMHRPQGISPSEACTLDDGFYTLSLIAKWHDGEESVWEFYKYNNILYYIYIVRYSFREVNRHPELWLDSYLYSYDCQTSIAKNMNMDNHDFHRINMRQWGKGSIVMTFEGLIEDPYTYFVMNLDINNLEKVVIEDFSGFDKYKEEVKEKVKSMYNEIQFNEYYSWRSFDKYRDYYVFDDKYSYSEIENIDENLIGDIIYPIWASKEWIDISIAKIDLLNKRIIFSK